VKDLNGSLNAIGEGINTGQRIMSFALENQILVSQAYFEVVSCLSDDYKALFQLRGVETDKHVREHTVYTLLPPGSREPSAKGTELGLSGASTPATPSRQTAAAHAPTAVGAPERQKRSRVPPLVAGALVIFIVALVTWRLSGSLGIKEPSTAHDPHVNATASRDVALPPAKSSESNAAVTSPIEAPTPQRTAMRSGTPVARVPKDENASAAQPAETKVTNKTNLAYDEGMRLIDEQKPAEAVHHFDDAIRANPNHVLAYLGRAQAHRLLSQFEMSIEDCNHAMGIKPAEPRVYFCRGFGEGSLKRYDLALRDYNEAIRLNPKFAPAYEMRGDANFNLQQFGRALEDFNQAIALKPNNAQNYLRRAAVYENLKQYRKAIQDCDQAISLQPGNFRAYNRRANAKKLSGDLRGSDADERQARQLK
jgi:Tfp pilus assembly protein PilF